MNKLCILLLSFCFTALQAQYVIPDPAFAAKLNDIVPFAMSGNVLDETHPSVVFRSTLVVESAGIQDLDGLQFFSSLQNLNCRDNPLTNIPDLSSTLVEFICNNCGLASLPSLPASLERLVCHNNELTALPVLPSTLQELECEKNELGAMPMLPAALVELNCSFNDLVALPSLPTGLEELNCAHNDIVNFPTLPLALETLDAHHNELEVLPTLPDALSFLDVSSNQLPGIPNTPSSLQFLYASFNQLGSLPPLTSPLLELVCPFNALTGLPQLPNSITYIDVSSNPLTALPGLPSNLNTLACANTNIGELPELPSALTALQCQNNFSLRCLPLLPSGLSSLVCSGTFIHCLPNIPSSLVPDEFDLGFSPVVCNLVNSDCPNFQEQVTGVVFLDENGDGIKDPGESGFGLALVAAQPGVYSAAPDTSGYYQLVVDQGSFSVDGAELPYYNKTTAAHLISLAAYQVDSLKHIGYQAIPGIYDLVTSLEASPASPGMDHQLWLQVQNVGTESTAANIHLTFDQDQSWVSSLDLPDAQIGNNAYWSPEIQPGDTWRTSVYLNTAGSVEIGTMLDHVLTAIPEQPDSTLSDNTDSLSIVAVGHRPAFDKVVSPAFLDEPEVQAGALVDYTIHFQNVGTDTATRVVVLDTLSADLEWSTLEFVGSSHTCVWYNQEGVLHVIYDSIHLADSSSGGLDSHGFIKFRMQPDTTLMEGDRVDNVANVYLELDQPTSTDTATLRIGAPYLELALKAFLGGPFDQDNGLMHDSLRVKDLIPEMEPYGVMGYIPTGPQRYNISADVLDTTGSNAIVDWVLLELREALVPSAISASRYALLQRNGNVVDLDGVSPVQFDSLSSGSYHVLIWHRNHLAAMSAQARLFEDNVVHLDFTDPEEEMWGTMAQKDVGGSTMLWPGNVNADAVIMYIGSGNDRDPILVEIGGLVPTEITVGYLNEDVNMDGAVMYVGANNDRDPILETIGGSVPTAVREEQVP